MATPSSKSTRVAIDTNFLFDLAAGSEIALEALEVIRKRLEGPVVVAPPTVLEELMLACKHPRDERERTYAPIAMQRMITPWKFQPVDLVPVGHGIVAIIADKIRERGYLPHEECNDAYILAEAALIGCVLLVTSDAHLLDAPALPLKLLLEAQDVASPLIVSPRKLAKEFFH